MNRPKDSMRRRWFASETPATTHKATGGGDRPGVVSYHSIINWPVFQWLLLIWVPAAVAGIYTKSAILRSDGYVKIALSLGRPGLSTSNMDATRLFTWGERLSFFRADLLLSVAVVPILLWLLSGLRRKSLLVWMVALISMIWIVVINVQLEALRLIGNFQPWDLLKDSLQWGLENSQQARAYIAGMALFRILALVGMVLIAACIASRCNIRSKVWVRRNQWAGIMLWALSLGVTGLSWLPWMPRTALHFSVHLATIAALPDSTVSTSLSSRSRAELEQRYRQLAQVPQRNGPPAYWASARDYDVLFYILETTPQRCVAFDGPIEDLPNIRKLREQAWVGARHYSTYPVTSRALFSILTSMYPPDNSKDNERFRAHVDSGMIRALTAAGYQTAVYGSSASITPWASGVFENLGFMHIRAAEERPGSSAWAGLGIAVPGDPHIDKQSSYVTYQQGLDLLALDQLKADVQRWTESNQRFAAVYLPQISHGPWGDIRFNGQETSLVQRCRALVEVQDRWLGDMLRFLEQRGRLSRTLIVVTGDHGIRSPVEDPALTVGATDSYTFQVPFLLYAPAVLDSSHVLHWVTSHIDVAPSILDLLGISRNTDYEQGTDVWDERITQRTTYFLANLLHGVDGYYSQGKFYSWNRTLDLTYENNQLQFGPEHVVPNRSALHGEITNKIRAFDELRSALFRASDR